MEPLSLFLLEKLMGRIKEELLRREEEEQELYLGLMEFLEENKELFSKLSNIRIKEEVYGYEE